MKNHSKVLRTALNIILPAIAFVVTYTALGLLAAVSVALITWLLTRTGISVFDEIVTPPNHLIPTNKRKRFDYLKICLFVLGIRIITYLLAYFFSKYSKNQTLFDSFRYIWTVNGTDAPHYLEIAENWYVTQGDARYYIVFFPLFPILIRLFTFLIGDYLFASILLNLFLSFAIGISAYELALIDYDRETALRFVKYIFIIPAAFFYAAPMTESLFMLLSLLCLFFVRKKNYLLCALFGALAAFTRVQGAILMLPCAYIAFNDFIHSRKEQKPLLSLARNWSLVLCISIGLIGYLLINYCVWGNPFKFSEFQWEHWHQKFGFFGNTLKTISDYLTGTLRKAHRLVLNDNLGNEFVSLWIPQTIACLVYPLCVILKTGSRKWAVTPTEYNAEPSECTAELAEQTETEKAVVSAETADAVISAQENNPAENTAAEPTQGLHNAYVLYFAAYYIISIGATWLLSAPRYLMVCMTVPLSLSLLSKNKFADYALTFVCILFSIIYLFMFAAGGKIY